MPLGRPGLEGVYRSLLPWFLPGTVAFAVIGLVLAQPLARLLRCRPLLAWAIVTTLGMIVAATLTPLHGQLDLTASGGVCDLSRTGLASLRDYLHLGDTSLNVVLFVPFGIAVGLLERRRPRAVLVALGLGLPFAIELTQLLVPALDRGCQSADVVDNLTGLVIGLAVGASARVLADWI